MLSERRDEDPATAFFKQATFAKATFPGFSAIACGHELKTGHQRI
jgi:hypothetical protein